MPRPQAAIVGSPVSPYVRKVLAVCALKDVPVEIDPIPPFYGDERFSEISPLRRIPVYRDDKVTLTDSSVICQYLEDRYTEPALFPSDIAMRAHARWLEEYADSRIGEVFIWRLFNAAVIAPAIFGRPRDKEAIAKVIETEVTEVMAYIEARAPAGGYFFGELSIADISLWPFFGNLNWSRVEVDDRWPKTKAWLSRIRAVEPFASLDRLGARLVRTPIPDVREATVAEGFKTTADTYYTPKPRLGPMTPRA